MPDFPAPSPADEQPHTPGAEELWNESWYFDAVAADGSLGAYVRIGLYPNLGTAWYTAYVTGPGRPAVAVVDMEAPLSDRRAPAHRDRLARGRAPLRAAAGDASRSRSPAPARHTTTTRPRCAASKGAPVPVALDLTWDTDGAPYAYRMATRYEIPCQVHGTIQVGDEQLELRGPGQRDHSWGVRDWWSMDWMWSAARLADGARVHAVQIRLPGAGEFGVGYVQSADGEPRELESVGATEEVAPDGLITGARLDLQPAGIALDVEPLAFGALRLVSPDGRTTSFPRAMCRFRTDDGGAGLGWAEWNLNQA